MIQKVQHSISITNLIAVLLVIAGGILLIKLADIVLLIFIALMLAAALDPLVKLVSRKMPISFAATIVVFGLILPLVAIIIASAPSFISQGPDILKGVTNAIHSTTVLPESIRSNIDLTRYSDQAGRYLLESVTKVTSILTTAIELIFLTIYLIIDRKNLKRLLFHFIPKSHRQDTVKVIRTFSIICGQFIRGNLTISIICGIFIFIGLTALGVPHAGLLALFAAMFDLLPLIGSIVAALPAVILGFTVSPSIGLLVVVLFTVYQQLENHILAPKIYNKALNLSPAASFIAVLVGAALYGIPGAFISLPIAASLPPAITFIEGYDDEDSDPDQPVTAAKTVARVK